MGRESLSQETGDPESLVRKPWSAIASRLGGTSLIQFYTKYDFLDATPIAKVIKYIMFALEDM